MKVNNFTVIESEYGRFIVNRHCALQAEALIKTGRPHIQAELNNLLTIANQLPPDCVAVDAGANIGLVAVPLAQATASRGGIVHAFEVQRMMYYALCGTVALNDIENLLVHHKALGAELSVLTAARPDYSAPRDFGLFSLTDQSIPGVETIDVVTIDSLGLPRLDLLKIDVEGMEIEVLQGARRTVERFRPCVWVEYWKVPAEGIKAQFADLGYTFYVMDALNWLCVPEGKLTNLSIAAPQA
jgi:FkbM family methyltransferase